jgi:hypothetical protein
MIPAPKQPGPCNHPMDDSVVLTYSLTTKDFMGGTATVIHGYYCPHHRQFGQWTVTSKVAVPEAVQALMNSEDDLFGPQ